MGTQLWSSQTGFKLKRKHYRYLSGIQRTPLIPFSVTDGNQKSYGHHIKSGCVPIQAQLATPSHKSIEKAIFCPGKLANTIIPLVE